MGEGIFTQGVGLAKCESEGFSREFADFLVGQERGSFDQAAEFFFTDLLLGALPRFEIFHGLVNDERAIPVDDA